MATSVVQAFYFLPVAKAAGTAAFRVLDVSFSAASGINAQLVRNCDMLIGMFWTKLGTSTGVAESGTVEEIDQFVADRKPAMLYFSNRPIEPSRIDLTQFARLKDFKEATYVTALVGSFSRVDELRN